MLKACTHGTRRLARIAALAGALFGFAATAHGQADVKGSADVAWVGRYEGSRIIVFQERQFDAAEFLTRTPASANRDEADLTILEGHRTRIVYQAPRDRSSLEVFRNYQQRLEGAGFKSVYACAMDQCKPSAGRVVLTTFGPDIQGTFSFSVGFFSAPRYAVYRLATADADRTVALFVGESTIDGPRVAIQSLERKAMETDKIVVPSALEMKATIASAGRVALYGIFFDTGDATVKPESQPSIDQVVALLKAEPSLSLVVVGHTDSQGDFTTNVRLSERRAAAVVAALVNQGKIAPTRLTAFGAGMSSPAAPNEDDRGRAKNRRVELVRR